MFAPAGVRQNAINFTSNTFNQVWNSLNTVARNFAQTGNVINADAQLQTLSRRLPYGPQVLLNTWLSDVNRAGTTASSTTVLQQDLISYLDNNEGNAFNVLKSGVNYSSDGLLTYNGRVNHNPPIGQQKVIGVTAK